MGSLRFRVVLRGPFPKAPRAFADPFRLTKRVLKSQEVEKPKRLDTQRRERHVSRYYWSGGFRRSLPVTVPARRQDAANEHPRKLANLSFTRVRPRKVGHDARAFQEDSRQ